MTNYTCKFITNEEKDTWETIVKNSKLSGFQQSFVWLNVKKQTNEQTFRIGIYKNNELIGGGLLHQYKINNETVLHCPEGPILDYENETQIIEFLKVIKSIKKQNPQIKTFKVEPRLELPTKLIKKYFQPSKFSQMPRNTIVIDLTKSLEEIKNNMSTKFKYNVRLAQKKGLLCEHHINPQHKTIDQFYELYLKTAERNKFKPKAKSVFQSITNEFNENITISIVYDNKEPIAAAFNISYGNRLTYYFGASDINHREKMPNNLLHYSIIKWAKKNDYTEYDLFGIAPKTNKNHPWEGFTKFKKQIQKKELNLIGAQDLALD